MSNGWFIMEWFPNEYGTSTNGCGDIVPQGFQILASCGKERTFLEILSNLLFGKNTWRL
jgi:hypothetical protein